MPLYEYLCADCGPFTAQRVVADRDLSAACPDCGQSGERAISLPNLSLMPASRRSAHARNEKSCHEPAVVTRHRCGSGCGCGKPASQDALKKRRVEVPKLGKFQTPRKKNRPWMLGH
ncbi:MAG TPA: zinc ribbon domain-containing protein [Verrucomicrobiae bacterium]|nr:zinc ribbon domain-containing protein [Verrucomicrobiae bacterium]